MRHVLGLDVSTTATKAVLVDQSGRVVGVGSSEYPFDTPHPLWAEQDPQLWWRGTATAVAGALEAAAIKGNEIDAVGLTGQMHGMVLLDADGAVLRPAILWNDQRTARQCEEIEERVGRERLLAITGNKPVTGLTAPKLLWTRSEQPEVWARVAHVLLPKDFVRYQLTGGYATDVADGSGTLLMDLSERAWSAEILADLDIPVEWLPDLFEGPQVTGAISSSAADAVGLPPETLVVAGGGDQAANAVGVGTVHPSSVALSLGTSGVVFATTDHPVIEPNGRVHAFCHAVPGRWHNMGVMLSAAGSLRWLRDTLAPDRHFSELSDEAATAPAGSDGLIFLPYLSGERTPHSDPLARAAFVGLTLRHARPAIIRSVMEGVAFGLRDGLDLMRAAGLEVGSQIRASGGGIRSPLWRQILADVLEVDVVTVSTVEGAAYGAALLATVGAGWYPTVDAAVTTFVGETSVTSPGTDVDVYRDAHRRYQELYPALAPTFHQTVT